MALSVRFFGHACFELDDLAGIRLCVDPFDTQAFPNVCRLVQLPTDHFTHVVSTHLHADHAAWHRVPSARLLPTVANEPGLAITSRIAHHDEFGGRLRGGTTSILSIDLGGFRTLHCGDLGEQPTGPLLDWMRAQKPDILILPVGGFFTLGPDAAEELAELIAAPVVVPCHAADTGFAFPQLLPRTAFAPAGYPPVEAHVVDLERKPEPHERANLHLVPLAMRTIPSGPTRPHAARPPPRKKTPTRR